MIRHGLRMLIKILLFLTIAIAVFGNAVLRLWNWLMPNIFGLHTITFWQAVGLLFLSWLLFGGWRGFRGPGGYRRGWYWRRRMMQRWQQMTPEEREKFRQGIRAGCGRSAPAATEPTA